MSRDATTLNKTSGDSPATSKSALEVSAFHGLVGLLMFAPLAFGAVEPWAIFVVEAGAALLLVLWAIDQARSPEMTLQWSPLFAPMAVFGLLIVFQIVSGRTAYIYETIRTTYLYCAYGALSFLMVQLLNTRARLKFLASGFSAYGFTVAAFALVQSLSADGKLYWLKTPRFGGGDLWAIREP